MDKKLLILQSLLHCCKTDLNHFSHSAGCFCRPSSAHLLFIAHRALAPDHDLAARLGLQLFGGHTTWPQYSAHKIELKQGREWHERRLKGSSYLLLVAHGALAAHHHLAARLLLQLLGGQAAWAEDTAHKIELQCRYNIKK